MVRAVVALVLLAAASAAPDDPSLRGAAGEGRGLAGAWGDECGESAPCSPGLSCISARCLDCNDRVGFRIRCVHWEGGLLHAAEERCGLKCNEAHEPTAAPANTAAPEPTAAHATAAAPQPTAAPATPAPRPPTAGNDDPLWGCGLLGPLPGISPAGVANQETRRLIDGIKTSSSSLKISYWNWNLAPENEQYLTSEFLFMPENWGAGPVQYQHVREAGVTNYLDSNGRRSASTMSTLFLGTNEPDIAGSCMGDMFGTCTASCLDEEVRANDCPAAHYPGGAPVQPNPAGRCNCWQYSQATGAGFWPLTGCPGNQPLPDMWSYPGCVSSVMSYWKETAAYVYGKGYKYLTTPLVAVDVTYAEKFLEHACGCVNGECSCQDASCGCPVYVGIHFYAYDCRPQSTGGYDVFRDRINGVRAIMEKYPFVQGAIANEIGMLNCLPAGDYTAEGEVPICVPDSGHYPASQQPDEGCPATDELPDGLATFVGRLIDIVIESKTSDGRPVVKGFSWFNENKAGGTYNLQLFDASSQLNKIGEAYIRACSKWAAAMQELGYI